MNEYEYIIRRYEISIIYCAHYYTLCKTMRAVNGTHLGGYDKIVVCTLRIQLHNINMT